MWYLHAGGGSFKSQMKKADRSGARYAAILGDDEAALLVKLAIKPLLSKGEQKTLKLSDISLNYFITIYIRLSLILN